MAATKAEAVELRKVKDIYFDKNRNKFRARIMRNGKYHMATDSNTFEEAQEKVKLLLANMPAKKLHGNSYIKPDWFTRDWYFEQKKMKVTSKSIASLLHITVRTLENWTREWRT